jgi:hypothetical protein
MANIPTNIRDIIFITGFVNIVNKPTHIDNCTGNYSLLDLILITDSISIIDSDTIHIDRKFSDHDGTYVKIACCFSNNKNYKRKIWDYNRADNLFMKQEISETDWVNSITGASDIHGAVSDFTSIFLKIASICIPSKEVIIKNGDKVWFDSTLRYEYVHDRFRKTFLRVKSVLTESKYKQQRNKVNN